MGTRKKIFSQKQQKSICFIEQQKDIVYTTYEVFFSIMQILLESVVKEERVFELNSLCSSLSMFLCIMRTWKIFLKSSYVCVLVYFSSVQFLVLFFEKREDIEYYETWKYEANFSRDTKEHQTYKYIIVCWLNYTLAFTQHSANIRLSIFGWYLWNQHILTLKPT